MPPCGTLETSERGSRAAWGRATRGCAYKRRAVMPAEGTAAAGQGVFTGVLDTLFVKIYKWGSSFRAVKSLKETNILFISTLFLEQTLIFGLAQYISLSK
jgi:hypothetical protein